VGSSPRSAPSPSAGVEQNIAGLLCWLPLGPLPVLASIFFLVAEPYKSNKFIAFHAWQALFTVGAGMALSIGLMIFGTLLSAVFPPFILLMLPIWWALLVAALGLAIYMSIKAYGNQTPRLPLVGEAAAKQVGM
jgi:uncharacterized membrane protein